MAIGTIGNWSDGLLHSPGVIYEGSNWADKLSGGSACPAFCGITIKDVPGAGFYLTDQPKEKDMKNKAYEFMIILLDENGEYTESVWDEGPLAIIAKSAEEAKIKAVKYAPEGEYGKDYTILVEQIKGE